MSRKKLKLTRQAQVEKKITRLKICPEREQEKQTENYEKDDPCSNKLKNQEEQLSEETRFSQC